MEVKNEHVSNRHRLVAQEEVWCGRVEDEQGLGMGLVSPDGVIVVDRKWIQLAKVFADGERVIAVVACQAKPYQWVKRQRTVVWRLGAQKRASRETWGLREVKELNKS